MKNIKGMVSIFLALIILPIYSIALASIDIVKILGANNHIIISNDIALYSLMSKYDRDFYNKYKIFALLKDEEYIKSYVNNILTNNIDKNHSNFYQAKLLRSDVNFEKNSKLLDGDNLEKQIISYMKLKGPYEMSKGAINLVSMVYDSKKFNNVIDKKYDYEAEYSKLNIDVEKLSGKIQYYDENFEEINKKIFNINSDLDYLKLNIREILAETSIEKLNEDDKNKISKLLTEHANKMDGLWTDIKIFKVNYEELKVILQNVDNNLIKLDAKLEQWNNSISKLDESDIKNNFKSEYKSARRDFTKENVEKFLKKIENSESIIVNMTDTIINNNVLFSPSINDLDTLLNNKFDLSLVKKLPSFNNYKIYKYLKNNLKEIEVNKSKRKEAKQNKKKLENFSKNLENIERKEDKNSIDKFIDKNNISEVLKYKSSEINNIKNSNNIKNYKNINNIMNKFIPSNKFNVLENIYLAQYIVDNFNNKLINEEFSSQIEYILFGNNKINRNNLSIESLIFAIRFSLNSIYAFTNSNLGTEATAMATAIAGWTGFGVPLLKSLILSSMSFGESILDLQNLNRGNYLELYKNKGTWQVSISGLSNLISSNIKDISNSAIDNIYESIIDVSEEGINHLNNNVNEFVNQSIDGLSQTIISEIITPVQTYIVNKININKLELRENINQIIREVELNIKGNNLLAKLKKQTLNIVKNNLTSLINIDEINFEKEFTNLTKKIENMIVSEVSGISNKLKTNISSVLNENKLKQKNLINNYIDDYLLKLGNVESKKISSKSSFSGLNFNYKDYLLAITILRLGSSDKSHILKRMALIMEYEIKKSNSSFSILKLYTNFNIRTEIEIDTFLLKKYIFLENIKNEITGGY